MAVVDTYVAVFWRQPPVAGLLSSIYCREERRSPSFLRCRPWIGWAASGGHRPSSREWQRSSPSPPSAAPPESRWPGLLPLNPHLHRPHHERREAPPIPRPVRPLFPPQSLKFDVEVVLLISMGDYVRANLTGSFMLSSKFQRYLFGRLLVYIIGFRILKFSIFNRISCMRFIWYHESDEAIFNLRMELWLYSFFDEGSYLFKNDDWIFTF